MLRPVADGKRGGGWVRQHRRLLAALAVVLVLLPVAAVVGGGWYYTGVLESDALAVKTDVPEFDLTVAAVGDGTVTLAGPQRDADAAWRSPGVYGLEWAGGYGQVAAILESGPGRVVRAFEPVGGSLAPGTNARADPYAFTGDPLTARGLPFEDVTVDGPLGPLPAWYVDGPSDTWAIMVHGHRGRRQEMLRLLAPVHDAGLKALVVTYRNDAGVAREPDGRYHFGATEWADIDAAVAYAQEHGADGVVLVGASLGGGIVMSFLQHSGQAGFARAAVLDAPMLDFWATVAFRARQRGAPGVVTAVGKRLASLRFGIDWGESDYLRRADELAVPVLLFHGDADTSVPVATSDRLARERPDLVTYERWPGVEHVRSWNADPGRYEATVRGFLERTVGGD